MSGVLRVSKWSLWTRTSSTIAYVLGIDSLAVALAAGTISTHAMPTGREITLAAILLSGATAHLLLTRRIERQRRARSTGSDPARQHIDLGSLWSFPAAILLPPLLIAVFVIVMRAQRYPIAAREPHRFLFTTASILTAALLSHIAVTLIGWPATVGAPGDLARAAAAVLAAAALWWWTQFTIVGGVMALTLRVPVLRAMYGDREKNIEHLATLAGAVLMVGAISWHPGWALLGVPLGVLGHHVIVLTGENVTDYLTGLLNRRGWQTRASIVLAGAQRRSAPVAVLAIDLDAFKDINDRHGHDAGDAVLATVGKVLREQIRSNDVAARVGGDEFLMLIEAEPAAARETAERLRIAVEKMDVVVHGVGGRLKILPPPHTASVGIVSFNEGHVALDVLRKAADQALYVAKHGGRNRSTVISASELPTRQW